MAVENGTKLERSNRWFSKKGHSNVGLFVYEIDIDAIDPNWVSLYAEFEGESGWIFVLKYEKTTISCYFHQFLFLTDLNLE